MEFSLKINIRCQWEKELILAVWPHSPKYPSINFLNIFTLFADHENMGKTVKFMCLLCTVKKLWLFALCSNMVIRPYMGTWNMPIFLELYIKEPQT